MTKYWYSLLLCCILLFGSCQSVQQLSIDYMVPADVSFPSAFKRVAVVNNMPAIPDNQLIVDEANEVKDQTEIARQTKYYNGDPKITVESLAQTLAEGNYFDLVAICDSALRTHDITPRESTLSREEVVDLTKNLDVDFLVAVENIQISSIRKVEQYGDIFLATLDAKVYPTIKVYIPNRNAPMLTINTKDSIFWEEFGIDVPRARALLINDKEMLKEASVFAGTIPIRHLLPYWQTGYRYLYINGSASMRDAAIFVRKENWDKAIELWKQTYEKGKGKLKMHAACNLALGYEMKDSIGTAEEWALIGQKLAYDIDGIEMKKNQNSIDPDGVMNYVSITQYLKELQTRKEGLVRLDMQMQRFKEDF